MARSKRPSAASRRFGYAVAVAVNLALLAVVNRWPGWDAISFLTEDTERVLGIVNASMIAGVLANAVFLVDDRRWFKAAGDLVTTAIGLAAAMRVWQVFPFDIGSTWALVAHVLLAIAIVGSVIGMVATAWRLMGFAAHGTAHDHGSLNASGRHR